MCGETENREQKKEKRKDTEKSSVSKKERKKKNGKGTHVGLHFFDCHYGNFSSQNAIAPKAKILVKIKFLKIK